MSASVITFAFENWKAQEAASGKPVLLNEFVFANVPNLDINKPIDRNESLPPASQIVYRQAVNKSGLASENAVAYSVTLGADTGNFDFNWIGLINKESGTIAMITHAPKQTKLKTQAGQQGNVLTRSFLLEFNGAALETQINTRAETWQIDFTARLEGIDEMQRLINQDAYGQAAFIGSGFQTVRNAEQFIIKSGSGYIGGLRGQMEQDQILMNLRNTKVYVDFSFQGNITSQWRTVIKISAATALANYVDAAGFAHFVFAVASVDGQGNVKDLRPIGALNEQKINAEVEKLQPKGNYLSVGDYGIGKAPVYLEVDKLLGNEFNRGATSHIDGAFNYWYGITLAWSAAEKTNQKAQIITGINHRDLYYRFAINDNNEPLAFGPALKIYSTGNTSADKGGFIRASGKLDALTTDDVVQVEGKSKTSVMSQVAVSDALAKKQATGNYLDKDSTADQTLKAPLYSTGEIGAGNPKGTGAALLMKTSASVPQLLSRLPSDPQWLIHTLPVSNGKLSLENTASKDSSGYIICGDTGMMIQWGELTASLTETDYKQFPVPFRQRCFQIIPAYGSFIDFGMGAAAYPVSNKDFIVTSRGKSAEMRNTLVRYIAIGY